MIVFDFLKESVRSGTIAAIAMMPVGLLFRLLGLRVGYYGQKLGEVLFGSPSQVVLIAQHFVIGWLSTAPLLLILVFTGTRVSATIVGALYGIAYYVLVNSIALPLWFGDPMPWQLGFNFIYPSLTIHIIFGASIGFTARKFVKTHSGSTTNT